MKNNNKNNLKNQMGSISIFTMLAMLFFLVVIVGAYMVTSKRAQTQIQSLGETQEKYGTESINDVYNQKIANVDKIPIYTKEQLWSVGTATKIEIDGILYDFSKNDFTKYELKNDIIINLEDDFKNSVFKDNLIYDSTNKYKTVYYYKGYYYVPTFYKEGSASYNLESGTPSLSAQFNESTKDWTISNNVTGLTGKYYLFAPKDSLNT